MKEISKENTWKIEQESKNTENGSEKSNSAKEKRMQEIGLEENKGNEVEKMTKYWYCNDKTREVGSYHVCGELTDFPRGEFLAYRDFIVTGFKTEGDANKWLEKHPPHWRESIRS